MSTEAATATTTEAVQVVTDMAAMEIVDDSKKGFFKRDALRANETAVQQKWADAKVFESNPESDKESFMVTFPYPYSNGHLHIGHAFSLTKAVFRAQYERHQGKNVLFPFAFHCTGMPIQAVRRSYVGSWEEDECCNVLCYDGYTVL
jgi:leucyl-tRNA synthetase